MTRTVQVDGRRRGGAVERRTTRLVGNRTVPVRASECIPDAKQSGGGGGIGAWSRDVSDAAVPQVEQVLRCLASAAAVVAGDRGKPGAGRLAIDEHHGDRGSLEKRGVAGPDPT